MPQPQPQQHFQNGHGRCAPSINQRCLPRMPISSGHYQENPWNYLPPQTTAEPWIFVLRGRLFFILARSNNPRCLLRRWRRRRCHNIRNRVYAATMAKKTGRSISGAAHKSCFGGLYIDLRKGDLPTRSSRVCG
jgi:hypothetical protein